MSEPRRGDVIVLDLPQDTSRALIKRIIGLPGETIILSNNTVEVQSPDGNTSIVLSEPYVAEANKGGASDMRITLGADEFSSWVTTATYLPTRAFGVSYRAPTSSACHLALSLRQHWCRAGRHATTLLPNAPVARTYNL